MLVNYLQSSFIKSLKNRIELLVTDLENKNRNVHIFRPFIHHVVESFGVNRCMFGSDWPVCRTGTQGPKKYLDVVEFVEKLLDDLPLLAKKKIFQENAVEFYQLQDVVDTGNQT